MDRGPSDGGQDPLSNDKHLDDDYQYNEWCYYSGLPNVLAYENHKKKLDEH